MALSSSSLQTPNYLHLSSMKLKITLLQTFIFTHIYQIAHAFSKAKSLILQLFKDINFVQFLDIPLLKRSKTRKNKFFFGSFRMHYNWCNTTSSHVMPVYYDSSWNSEIAIHESTNELTGYLDWLEQKGNNEEYSRNEIDKLADLFIANCHEKFRLEKVESYRKYQEMLARSI